jgi:hypothetical protein
MELLEIHNTFRNWVKDLRDQGVEASFSHDLDGQGEDRLVVSAVLLTARVDPERRAHASPRRRASTRPLARLRYLIAVGGSKNGAQVEQALLELMVRAQHAPGITLLGEALSSSWWLACGVPPRPAFMLEVGVHETVERESVTPVREIRLDLGAMHSVHGRVEAADATPIAGAEIQLIATGLIVRSDHRGAFRLQICDPGPGGDHGRVRVRARGVEQWFDIPGPTTVKHPWMIRLEQIA